MTFIKTVLATEVVIIVKIIKLLFVGLYYNVKNKIMFRNCFSIGSDYY